MLKSLSLENFTVFSSARFDFSPGINVIVGENGTGKTHVLKAGYCLNRAWPDLQLDRLALTQKRAEVYFEKRLMGLFQPEHLESLIRWCAMEGRLTADVLGFEPAETTVGETQIGNGKYTQFSINHHQNYLPWDLSIINSEDTGQVALDAAIIAKLASLKLYVAKSIFIPSKEIVSFYEGLGGLLDQYEIKLDATYRDMVVNFDFPELSNVKLGAFKELEDILGGFLKLEGRKLVFIGKDGRKTDPPLLAEGLRKLAMLPYFIRCGVLHIDGRIPTIGEALFWDEPETNLNPRLIAKLAQLLVFLAKRGTQVILATHSLFFLKEIDLQLQLAAETAKVPARFFALGFGDDGVNVSAGDSLEEIDPITALNMEIDQANRYNEWYYRASRAD